MTPKPLKPLYFLVGEDEFRKGQFLKRIRSEVFPDGGEALNYEYLPGGEVDAARILDAARSLSWNLFSAPASPDCKITRLVVVDQAEKIPPADWKRMDEYFQEPSPETCLIFLVHRRSKNWPMASVLPKGTVISFEPLKGEKLYARVRAEASEWGLTLDGRALQDLVWAAGGDLRAICGELDKLALYKETEGAVTAEEVREVVGSGQEANVFALTRLIVLNKSDQALALLTGLLEGGEAPLRILNLLASQFRKLWLARERWEKTKNPELVAREANVWFYRSDFIEQVKGFKLSAVPFIYRRLFETNLALKKGAGSPRLVLEQMIIDLSGGGAGRVARAGATYRPARR